MSEQKHCAKCDRPDSADHLVGCDTCETWMHYGCAQVTDSIADVNRSWKCDRCRGEESIAQSRVSVGRSNSSKRSSRIGLSLQMMEEQKAIRMRSILEEEAAQAATRRRLAEEEEDFLKKKYELLLTEAEESEDEASRKSRLSSRASREKVRSWLSEQEVGTAHRVKEVPPSIPSTTVTTKAVQQSIIPAPITPTPNASTIPAIVTMNPTLTSTPNLEDDSKGVEGTVATTIQQASIPLRPRDDFVYHNEITFGVPLRSLGRSSIMPRSNSAIGMNSFVAIDPTKAPRRVNGSAPPSIIDIDLPPTSSRSQVTGIVNDNIPVVVSDATRATGCGNGTVACPSSTIVKFLNDSRLRSVVEVSRINYEQPVFSFNNTFVTTASALSQPRTTHNPTNSYNSVIVPEYITSNPTVPLLTGGHGYFARGYSVASQSHNLSVPLIQARPSLNTVCQPTWSNNNVNSSVGLSVNHGSSASTHAMVPPVCGFAPSSFEIPSSQSPTGHTQFYGPSSDQRSQPQQHFAIAGRSGPTSEQMAARQVMPRDLPNFSGDPEDWPLFYSAFSNSTEACGYTDSENLARLQRCLKGRALEAVKSRLLMPQSVSFVIDILRRLYGRPEILMHSLLQKLQTVPSPKIDDLQSQIKFGLAVQNVVDHMCIANLSDHLWNPTLLHELVEKLPPQIKMQWSYHKSKCACVNMATFSAFMYELVAMASDVTLPVDALTISSKLSKPGKERPKLYVHSEEDDQKTEVIETKMSTEQMKKTCTYCASPTHEIANCVRFKELDLNGRWKAIKERKLCRSCLVPHRKWPCRSNKECGIDDCGVHHHKLLHSISNPSNNIVPTASTSRVEDIVHQNLHSSAAFSLFRYLPVTIHGNGKQIKTFAFLDDGSSSTLLESGIASTLGLTGPTDNFYLSWTGNISREEKRSQRVSVIIYGDREKYKLNNVRTVQDLCLPSQTLQYEVLHQKYPHLKGLPIRSYIKATPGIIIGLEHVRLLTSLRVREGGDNEPVATKTRLGWCIYGKDPDKDTAMERLNLHLFVGMENLELHEWMKHCFAIEESCVTIKLEGEEDKREQKRHGWLRGEVVDVIKAADGKVRRAVVKTNNGILQRPAVKLALLDLCTAGDGPEHHGQGYVARPLCNLVPQLGEFGTARICQLERS